MSEMIQTFFSLFSFRDIALIKTKTYTHPHTHTGMNS